MGRIKMSSIDNLDEITKATMLVDILIEIEELCELRKDSSNEAVLEEIEELCDRAFNIVR